MNQDAPATVGERLVHGVDLHLQARFRPMRRSPTVQVERGEGVAQRDGTALARGLHLLARVGDGHRLGHRRVRRAGGVGAERAGPGRSARCSPARPTACAPGDGPGGAWSPRAPCHARRHPQELSERTRARLQADGVAQRTGGQSMPSTVTAGRAPRCGRRIRTRADQLNPVQHLGVLAGTLLLVLQAFPARVPLKPHRDHVVKLTSWRAGQSSTRISAPSASGAAPPNWPECRLPSSVSLCQRELTSSRAG